MAAYNVTQGAWGLVAPGLVQVRGGRVKLAISNSPSDEDWLILVPGESLTTTVDTYAQALDKSAIVVSLEL